MTTEEDESAGLSPSAPLSEARRAATRGSALRGGTESGTSPKHDKHDLDVLAVPPSWVQVCVCVCVCVCVYFCVCACVHVHAHMCMHKYIHDTHTHTQGEEEDKCGDEDEGGGRGGGGDQQEADEASEALLPPSLPPSLPSSVSRSPPALKKQDWVKYADLRSHLDGVTALTWSQVGLF